MPRTRRSSAAGLASVVTRQLATWRKNARHEGTWSLDVTPTGNGEPHEWAVGEPDAGYQVIEYWEIVERELQNLSAVHRRVVELRVFEEYPPSRSPS